MTFRDDHREFQELVRELTLLRAHNLQFKDGAPQTTILMFAEAALVLVILERFVRMVLGPDATDDDTLQPLLEKATGQRLALLTLRGDRLRTIGQIMRVRNTLLHANYEQAAREAGCSSVREYFRLQFAAEIETIFEITDSLVSQIDPETGGPLRRG